MCLVTRVRVCAEWQDPANSASVIWSKSLQIGESSEESDGFELAPTRSARIGARLDARQGLKQLLRLGDLYDHTSQGWIRENADKSRLRQSTSSKGMPSFVMKPFSHSQVSLITLPLQGNQHVDVEEVAAQYPSDSMRLTSSYEVFLPLSEMSRSGTPSNNLHARLSAARCAESSPKLRGSLETALGVRV